MCLASNKDSAKTDMSEIGLHLLHQVLNVI